MEVFTLAMIGMIVIWEGFRPDFLRIMVYRQFHPAFQIIINFDEFRGKLLVETQHVVEDKDLSIAMWSCTNANSGDVE